ncbi:MAG: hypothetical protein WD423_01040, partial [Rhodothermales bacterium]
MFDSQPNAAPLGSLSRRRFLQTAAAAILPITSAFRGRAAGVQIGAISYSFRALPTGAEDVLSYLKQAGLTTVELMGGTAEAFAGLPDGPERPPRGTQLSDAERAEYEKTRDAYETEARSWRLSAPTDRFAELG